MGSVQIFPRRCAVPLAPAWRFASVATEAPVRVRPARLEDYAAMHALQRQPHCAPGPLSLRQFESQRHAFAEGQLVAECAGRIVGAASSLVVRWDDYASDPTWTAVTGDGFFTSHDPFGHTLYAAQFVSEGGGAAVRALMQALRRLCRGHNLRRAIVASRLAGYRAMRHAISAEHYARRVIWGDLDDANLRFPLAHGFQFCGILANYLPADVDSGGHAALFVWLNPLYVPPGPGACEQSERARKCA